MNPITRMMKRYIKTPLKYALPLFFIGSIVLVSMSGCTSPATTSPSPSASSMPTAKPTAVTTAQATKSVAKTTATPKPTATPTATPKATPTTTRTTTPPVTSILVEQPASASGPDLSAQINSNTGASQTGLVFYRVTINGRDAYAAHDATNVAFTDEYVFPFSSYSDAQALQANLVSLFTAKGFTVSGVSQNVWGPDSINTGLNNGRIVISASNSATVRPDTNMLNSGSEVDVMIGSTS